MFLKSLTNKSTEACSDKLQELKTAMDKADAIIIGAGAGLSASAGFTYSGKRFERYFHDFADKYHIRDIYSGGFYPFQNMEEYWAWWSRHIWINRYMDAPRPVYDDLFALVRDRDYFVLTTNVDHCFQKAGFDKHRMFYTQGDYGLFQCSEPCHNDTYDNEDIVRGMVQSQGYTIAENGDLIEAKNTSLKMAIPSELVPCCPKCGKPMSINLRSDDTFVEDKGWHTAWNRWEDFLRRHDGMNILFLELGVGGNTPGIIKYPFWRMTAQNEKAVYVCINYGEAFAPDEIRKQAICINGDIGEVITELKSL
ncbi:MAG: Sir2 silent information regulator family NAD-dependent deacetylase [Lachnospiraceae bacterium]|nr:Sir2 silent information regulator family NAD-dependent deacetylase [Lachnospiraceae bacterium]